MARKLQLTLAVLKPDMLVNPFRAKVRMINYTYQ